LNKDDKNANLQGVKMKKLPAIFSAILVLGLILASCERPPEDEMNAAQDAVTRAENDANAVTYAGNTLIRARDALSRMQAEADSKRYDAAKSFAAEAISAAEKAIEDGRTGAARAREEALNLVNGLRTPLAETSASLGAAREVPNIDLDFDALSSEMAQAREDYDDARQSLAEEDYRDTVAKCLKVRSLLADINGRRTEAAQAASRKK
jgi:hypothetical protein